MPVRNTGLKRLYCTNEYMLMYSLCLHFDGHFTRWTWVSQFYWS